jgi:hypothetical protein
MYLMDCSPLPKFSTSQFQPMLHKKRIRSTGSMLCFSIALSRRVFSREAKTSPRASHLGLRGRLSLPSLSMPIAGTTKWICGCSLKSWVQVWSIPKKPHCPPRCLGLLQYVLDRLSGAGEEDPVKGLGTVTAKPTQLPRQREGDHEVIHGKTVFQFGVYPLGRICCSASWA